MLRKNGFEAEDIIEILHFKFNTFLRKIIEAKDAIEVVHFKADTFLREKC
jgi:hypothetical protein